MTTPADNRESTLQTPTKAIITYWDGHQNFLDVIAFLGRFYNHRPESVYSPFVDGLWRYPTPWFHSGGRFATHGGQTVLIGKSPAVAGARNILFPDGSYWSGLPHPALGGASASLVNRCITKALLKLKNQKVNLGVALAEARQTAELITGGARSIANQVNRFKKKFPKDFAKAKQFEGSFRKRDWRNIPSRWLELQYGWKPLMADVFGAASALSEQAADKPLPCHVVKNEQDPWYDELKRVGFYGSEQVYRRVGTVHCKVRLDYTLADELLVALSSLGVMNPTEVIYEKLKYSFVVDWFSSLGNWISVLDADLGLAFRGGSMTSYTTASTRYAHTVVGSIGDSYTFVDDSFVFGEEFAMNRTTYSETPVPGLYFKNPLSGIHIANALSLLVQAFR